MLKTLKNPLLPNKASDLHATLYMNVQYITVLLQFTEDIAYNMLTRFQCFHIFPQTPHKTKSLKESYIKTELLSI